MTGSDDLDRSEIEAVIETRRDLGPEYEPALVDSFVEKVEAAIEQRVDARLAARQRSQAMERRHSGQQLALGIVSLVLGIPITAITLAVGDGSLIALMIAWVGIAVVNIAYAWQGRREG
jgi:cytochrome P450